MSAATVPRQIAIRERSRAPLTPLQEDVWNADQTHPESGLLLVSGYLRLIGKVDTVALQAAMDMLLERHEVLRTVYQFYELKRGDDPTRPRVIQMLARDLRVEVQEAKDEDTLHLQNEQALLELIRDRLLVSFQLAEGPLLRATLLRVSENESVLVLVGHRIVVDESSMNTLFRDLGAIYSGLITGTHADLPPIAGSYLDFAAGNQRVADPLRAAPPGLSVAEEVGADLGERSNGGSPREVPLPLNLHESLSSLARGLGVSPWDLYVATLLILHARYTGEEVVSARFQIDQRIGTGNRFDHAVGPFTTPLVVEFRAETNDTVLTLAKNLHQAISLRTGDDKTTRLSALDLSAREPECSMALAPSICVAILKRRPLKVSFAGLHTGEFRSGAKPRLTLSFCSESDQPPVFLFPSDLYAEAPISGTPVHYRRLLESVVRDAGVRLGEVGLVGEDEEQELLRSWRGVEAEYPQAGSVYGLFEEQVERSPDRVAVLCGEEQLSYGELNVRANQLAHLLTRQGVGRGHRVGLYVERSLEMLVGLLGIQKSGAAYVPLDPGYPEERIRQTLEEARTSVVVVGSGIAGRLGWYGGRVLSLEREGERLRQQSRSNPGVGAGGNDAVYVIFTSGSTGRPKGVEVAHGGVVNLLRWMGKELAMGERDVFPALASFAFDMSVPELYLSLVTGGRVVVGDRHLAGNGEELAAFLRRHGATVVHATPTTWSLLLDAGFSGAGVKRVVGAEPLPQALFERLLEADASLYNFYGPTETTVWSTYHHFRSKAERVVIGRAIANTELYILDPDGNVCPAGVRGELYIGGSGVALGYLHRPELTAERFLLNRFTGKGRLYRTGDLVRALPDGRIEFAGRLDHQVKVRGYRIELGEIESVVGAHAAVGQCVVLARQDQPGVQRLVAYVTPRQGQSLSIPELRRLVKEKLPDYMTPSAWVLMEQLPRTPAGKIDRKKLPEPDHERPELEASYVAPETPVEKKLAAIWRSALGIKSIGINDNYFELGAESLLTARVFARITREFGRQISPTALFAAPTIRELSVLLNREEERNKSWTCLVPIRRSGTRPPLFCIHGGAGSILFYHNFATHLDPDQPVYALQSQGLYGDAPPHTRVEEMAEHYIREIRTVQVHGPYRLAGYCFGMIVAYEMAQRLRAAGEEIALLASINGTAPLYGNGPGAGGKRPPRPGLLGRVRRAFEWRRNHITALITEQRRRYYVSRGIPLPAGLRDMFFRETNFYAERDYTALPYPGRFIIFRAKGLYHDPDLGWKPFLTGKLDVYDIPGQHRNHRNILDEPIVRDLARTFDDVLRSSGVAEDDRPIAINAQH